MQESQHLEFKRLWKDEYLKWICAFANTNGGTLMLGYNDQGEVVGLKNINKLLEGIPNKVRDVLGILIDVNLVTDKNLSTLHLKVAPYLYPISYKGEYHYRSGSTKQELKGAALDKFLMRKQGITWDAVPVLGVKITNLNEKTLNYFREQAIYNQRLPNTLINESTASLLEKLLSKHESIPYNPDIANAFFRAGLIESWGRGIERIIEACQQDNYPAPKWKLEPNGLWVIFELENTEQLQGVDGCERLRSFMNDYEHLQPEEKKLIEHLYSFKTITRKQVVELIGVQPTKAYYLLDSLVEKNILQRQGQGRGTYYQLKPN